MSNVTLNLSRAPTSDRVGPNNPPPDGRGGVMFWGNAGFAIITVRHATAIGSGPTFSVSYTSDTSE